MIVALCLGHAAHDGIPGAGQYLKAFDFDAWQDGAIPGSGKATFTEDVAEAMRFADMAEFHAFYVRQPKDHPTRPDGHPNRPMTGYHWQLDQVAE